MKTFRRFISIMLALITVTPIMTFAAPPDMPGGSNTNISHSGNTTISDNTTKSDESYTSSKAGENALLVTGGESTINSCLVNKTGDESSENSDFYGTNAGVLVKSGTLNIKGGTITTNGAHANGVFAYDKGVINISDATINTTANNSGGIMVTGGGVLNATNLKVLTKGNSSAAIRSDRGGGNLTVNGGTYETNGVGSPAIYSTANIVVNNATLTSTASEGVVVEGKNSITLNNVTLTDTNNTLNGNSETYKNIFLYQSMSGDADQGTASFTAKDSTITTNKGDTIFVTNTTATIDLENNSITNNDQDFVRIQKGKWGNSGSNGGIVTLNMKNQKAEGNIIVDSISELTMNIESKSVLKTAINTDNTAKKIDINISSDSVIVLTGNSYISSLTNEDKTNSNIYLNGYKLYVDGKEVSGNNSEYKETKEEVVEKVEKNHTKNTKYLYFIIPGVVILLLITSLILINNSVKKKMK